MKTEYVSPRYNCQSKLLTPVASFAEIVWKICIAFKLLVCSEAVPNQSLLCVGRSMGVQYGTWVKKKWTFMVFIQKEP